MQGNERDVTEGKKRNNTVAVESFFTCIYYEIKKDPTFPGANIVLFGCPEIIKANF